MSLAIQTCTQPDFLYICFCILPMLSPKPKPSPFVSYTMFVTTISHQKALGQANMSASDGITRVQQWCNQKLSEQLLSLKGNQSKEEMTEAVLRFKYLCGVLHEVLTY
jgi:hypothetical protein